MAAGPDGFFATEGDAYSVNSYDAAGRLRRIIRLARGPRPVTDRIRRAHEEEVRARNLDPEALERALASPYPTHLPTFFRLLVDPDGNLWAVQRRYDPGDEATATDMHDYFVFGPDGRHLGVVEVPARLQAFQIGADFILGKVTDDLGVEYVHRHEIEKSPARPLDTVVRDSAGIRIIENPPPAERSRLGWRIGPEPTLTIGAVDGEAPYIFAYARAATRLSDGRIVVADYGSMELRIFDGESGTHLATRGGVGEAEAVGSAPEAFAESRREWMATPVAEHFPAFASVMSDRAGHLWVEEYGFPGEEVDGGLWTVFDPDGHVLGLVETPPGLAIHEIGEDYILARVQDDLGVEYVQLWPLEREGSR